MMQMPQCIILQIIFTNVLVYVLCVMYYVFYYIMDYVFIYEELLKLLYYKPIAPALC